jgi:hypothetical protein
MTNLADKDGVLCAPNNDLRVVIKTIRVPAGSNQSGRRCDACHVVSLTEINERAIGESSRRWFALTTSTIVILAKKLLTDSSQRVVFV